MSQLAAPFHMPPNGGLDPTIVARPPHVPNPFLVRGSGMPESPDSRVFSLPPSRHMVPQQIPIAPAPVDTSMNRQSSHARPPRNQQHPSQRPTQQKVASSGAWKTIGDDLLHGPKAVFSRQPSPDQLVSRMPPQQNAHNGYRNSTMQHQRPGSLTSGGIQPECTNRSRYMSAYATRFNYDPCSCKTCHRNDCTLYVTGFEKGARSDPLLLSNVQKYFQRYGQVVRVWWQHQQRGLFVRFVVPFRISCLLCPLTSHFF
ncbi:hypothetical protein F5Y05DRAFT_281103 [Hypoxylon sp. FL0543]|nr:hypothetical protein F5Y05DRAFT_281103 [Hypoxylon sp. FL0543]